MTCLNLNSDNPKLMPANSLYSPIELVNKNVSILGIAIGIIKLYNLFSTLKIH